MDAGVPKTAWKRLEDFIQRAYNTQFIASYLDFTYDASSANASLRILGTIHRFTAPTPESGKEGCAREAFMRAALHKILNEAQVHRARLPQLRALAATYSQTSTLTPIEELFPELNARNNGHMHQQQQAPVEQPRLTASSFGSTWKSTPNIPASTWGQETTPMYQQQQQNFQQPPQQQQFANGQWGSHPNHQAPMYTGPPTQFQLDAPPPSAVERLQAFILDLYGEHSDLFDQIIYTQDRPTGLRLLEREYVATASFGDKGIDREAATRSALQQGALSHILAQRAPGNPQLHSAAVDIIPSWSDIASLPPLPPPQPGGGMPGWSSNYPVPQSPYHSNGYSTPITMVPMPPTSPYHAPQYGNDAWGSNDESGGRRERSSSKLRERSSSRRRSRSVSKRHRSRSRSRRRHRSGSDSEDDSMSEDEVEEGEAIEEGEERERRRSRSRHRSKSKSSKRRSQSRSSKRSRRHRSRSQSRSRSRRREDSPDRERECDRGRSRSRRRTVSRSRSRSRRRSPERQEEEAGVQVEESAPAALNGAAALVNGKQPHQNGSSDGKAEPARLQPSPSPLLDLGMHISPLLDYLLDAMEGTTSVTAAPSLLSTLSSGEREKVETIRQACELSSVMHKIRAAVEMNEIGPSDLVVLPRSWVSEMVALLGQHK